MNKMVIVVLFLLSSMSVVQPMMQRRLPQFFKRTLVLRAGAAHLKHFDHYLNRFTKKQIILRDIPSYSKLLEKGLKIIDADNQVINVTPDLIADLVLIINGLSGLEPSRLSSDSQTILNEARIVLIAIEEACANISINDGYPIVTDQVVAQKMTVADQSIIAVYVFLMGSFIAYYLCFEVPDQMKKLNSIE